MKIVFSQHNSLASIHPVRRTLYTVCHDVLQDVKRREMYQASDEAAKRGNP